MILRKILNAVVLVLFVSFTNAQDHQSRFESLDVMQYIFELHLNDSTNRIEGNAFVVMNLMKPVKSFTLDLASLDSTKKGMVVESVKVGSYFRSFTHENNLLKIECEMDTIGTSDIFECTIKYSGIPSDGLIISKNKFGSRTFFGDNWPDRARHWLPTVDHPSDKSPVIFVVYAPEHYDVVSNGLKQKRSLLNNGIKKTVWNAMKPISTKLMVIGVADFAVGNEEIYNNIPVSSWVFPQNKKDGFLDYQYGVKALKYFTELVGPYSYEKLAHVQSKTRYGGMENASCIFYSERTVNGKNEQERLFAHETAHQWFGNSITEQNWHHIWLSEGFATYFTHVYNQNFFGEEKIKADLKKDRIRVIQFAKKKLAPIIDTTVTEYIQLLNANSYQKASWFLHMLRNKLGDDIFFKGIQKYYEEFQNSTALTKDFLNVMENVSGKELDSFFKQWLMQAGHPILSLNWKQKPNYELVLKINQVQQNSMFTFPLEIKVQFKNGNSKLDTLKVDRNKNEYKLKFENTIESITLDPNVNLLFEEVQ